MPVSLRDIVAAESVIRPHIRQTPVLEVDPADFGLDAFAAGGGRLTLKLECLQHTGSFKPRGVFNLLLSKATPTGVVTASGGNAGAAVAYAAQQLALAATVFVPTSTPAVKADRIRALGAAIEISGDYYADAYAAAVRRAGSQARCSYTPMTARRFSLDKAPSPLSSNSRLPTSTRCSSPSAAAGFSEASAPGTAHGSASSRSNQSGPPLCAPPCTRAGPSTSTSAELPATRWVPARSAHTASPLPAPPPLSASWSPTRTSPQLVSGCGTNCAW